MENTIYRCFVCAWNVVSYFGVYWKWLKYKSPEKAWSMSKLHDTSITERGLSLYQQLPQYSYGEWNSTVDSNWLVMWLWCDILAGKPPVFHSLERYTRGWKDNVRIHLGEMGYEGGGRSLETGQDCVKWRAFVSAVLNLPVVLPEH
jgi:hypothetical protein